MHFPRMAHTLLGHIGLRPRQIARRQAKEIAFGHFRRVELWDHLNIAAPVHKIQNLARVRAAQIRFQRPRSIVVTNDVAEVGHAPDHHPLIDHRVGHRDLHPVDEQLGAAQQLHFQSGRGHDNIGGQRLARRQLDAFRHEAVDRVGNYRNRPRLDCFEQVRIGHRTYALVPRIVARRKMRLDVVIGAKRLLNHADQPLLRRSRIFADQLEHDHADDDVFQPHGAIRQPLRQQFAEPRRNRVSRRYRRHIGRGPLQHRHMRRRCR